MSRPDGPRRIVIVGMNYAPEIAGVGRYTGEIGAHLAAQGHEVCVVTTAPHYPGWRAQSGYSARRWTRELVDGVTVYRCPLYLHADMRGIRRLLAPLSFALAAAPVALWQIIRRRPHVVLAVEPTLFAAPVTWLAARLVGARTILHVQDLEVDAAFAVGHLGRGGGIARLGAGFDRAVSRGFDRVVTISERMRDRLVAKGVTGERITLVRNWVDLDQIQPIDGASPYRRELGLDDDAFVVLYAGNIGAKQGVRLLIEAADRLRDDPRIMFIVVGDGPMAPEIDTAAGRLPNLRRLPFQPEARFRDLLGLADLHALPQERDAADLLLPSKLGGMLASGRSIVVTADPGTELADFLGDSCAFVPPGDADALAAAIAGLSIAPADPATAKARLALARQLDKRQGLVKFASAVLAGNEEAGAGLSSKGRRVYEHPHERMARERRRALLVRRLAIGALVVAVTGISISVALVVGA